MQIQVMIPSIDLYKLILRSILILECDFCFNFNPKLNNVTEATGQIISAHTGIVIVIVIIFLGATD